MRKALKPLRYLPTAVLAVAFMCATIAPGPPVPHSNPATVDRTWQHNDEIDNSQ